MNDRDADLIAFSRRLELVGDTGWVMVEHGPLSVKEARTMVASRSFPKGCDTPANHLARLESYTKERALRARAELRDARMATSKKERHQYWLRRRKEHLRRDVPLAPIWFYFDREYEGT